MHANITVSLVRAVKSMYSSHAALPSRAPKSVFTTPASSKPMCRPVPAHMYRNSFFTLWSALLGCLQSPHQLAAPLLACAEPPPGFLQAYTGINESWGATSSWSKSSLSSCSAAVLQLALQASRLGDRYPSPFSSPRIRSARIHISNDLSAPSLIHLVRFQPLQLQPATSRYKLYAPL